MKPVNRVVYVRASFKPIGKDVEVEVPTGEKKRGFFGGTKAVTRKEKRWKQTGRSSCMIDGRKLAQDIADAIVAMNAEGYEVVSMLPVISGSYNYRSAKSSMGGGWGWGYGYSYTEGVVMVSRRITSEDSV